MEELKRRFQDPPAAYRGKPFWSWNGELEEQELLRQIGIFEQMGMGGYFCHSRTGLITEYLGEEWFSLINACADEGEKRGMGNMAVRRGPLAERHGGRHGYG